MKSQSSLLYKHLPQKYSKIYNDGPILYLYKGNTVLCAYSFDKKKKVILVKNYTLFNFFYMSIYQFFHEGWKVISRSDFNQLKVILRLDEDLPF